MIWKNAVKEIVHENDHNGRNTGFRIGLDFDYLWDFYFFLEL